MYVKGRKATNLIQKLDTNLLLLKAHEAMLYNNFTCFNVYNFKNG